LNRFVSICSVSFFPSAVKTELAELNVKSKQSNVSREMNCEKNAQTPRADSINYKLPMHKL
jgi:hypothetical protein